LIWGGNHRVLAPTSLFLGGAVLMLCDLLSRLILAPSEIPVGVITSMLGAPFFFLLLMRRAYRF
jgi:iron complex transport system permease protein